MDQHSVRNHRIEVTRNKRRYVILKIFAAKFFEDGIGRKVQRSIKLDAILDNALDGGLYGIGECASKICAEFIQRFLRAIEGFLCQICAISVLVPSRDCAHEQRDVDGEQQPTEIWNYAGRLRSTFSFISDSVVISGCRVYT